ncbi:DUF6441 family protein [Roseomonas sp. NAR14]|uniref:DUF6441 family protein n=1 Tax=Roseomonas acroporae TaxID=2937791 RepID=A0A9X1YCI6_9PROT|nr:DUF6441 family protein [Roseomonas acroporae]MCK8787638.1 DUF6441 family protein [Roseomonas acroporae]
MTVRFSATLEGKPAEWTEAIGRNLATAVTEGMVEAWEKGLKTDLRSQVNAVVQSKAMRGGGTMLGNAVRARVYPKVYGTVSPRSSAEVYATYSAGDILQVLSQGATIVPKAGKALAIPTAAVPRLAQNQRMTPRQVEARTGKRLTFIPGKGRGGRRIFPAAMGALAVVGPEPAAGKGKRRRGRKPQGRLKVMFWLIRQAVMPKKISPEQIAQGWADRLPALVQAAAARLTGNQT